MKDMSDAGITETLLFSEMHGKILTVGMIGKKPG